MPVTIRELSDTETMELALIENLQREDLSPIEEALGYKSAYLTSMAFRRKKLQHPSVNQDLQLQIR